MRQWKDTASGVSEVKIWKALGDFSRNAEDRGADGDVLLDPFLSGHRALPIKPWLKFRLTPRIGGPVEGCCGLPGACSGHPLAVSYFHKFSATSTPVKAEASFPFS